MSIGVPGVCVCPGNSCPWCVSVPPCVLALFCSTAPPFEVFGCPSPWVSDGQVCFSVYVSVHSSRLRVPRVWASLCASACRTV